MGNNNSQSGSGYLSQEQYIKNTINNIVDTETIGYNDSDSDIDFESIKDLTQNGGAYDMPNVQPQRKRYTDNPPKVGGNKDDVINDQDYQIIMNMIKKNETVPQQNGGSAKCQTGGCGCSAGDPISPTSDDEDTDTSKNPVKFSSLKGKKCMKGGNKEKDLTTSDSDSDDDDLEDEDDDDDDEESEESDSEESEKPKKHEQARSQKRKRYAEGYIDTSSQSDDILVDTKYIYSENNAFYGSDDISEQYKEFKNRQLLH